MHIYTHLFVFIGFRLYVRAWGIGVHGVQFRIKVKGLREFPHASGFEETGLLHEGMDRQKDPV